MCSAESKTSQSTHQIKTFDQLRSAVAELGPAQPQLVRELLPKNHYFAKKNHYFSDFFVK